MKKENIYQYIDYTLLKPTATINDFINLCKDAGKYNTASVCVPPSKVKLCKNYFSNVCTVIGFPLGYNTLKVKEFETKQALKNGANEIDMVVNINNVKDKNFNKVENEIKKLKEICDNHILKVIVETAYLTDSEKIELCKIITNTDADFIKTSTGFATPNEGVAVGATFNDIKLFKKNIGKNVKIKASGGIKTADDMIKYLELGVNRIGASTLP